MDSEHNLTEVANPAWPEVRQAVLDFAAHVAAGSKVTAMSLVLNWRNRLSSSDWHGGTRGLLVAWLASMISMPIVQWVAGDRALLFGVVLSVVLQAALVVLLVYQAAGCAAHGHLVATVAVVAWAAEAIGSKTGFPFGAYHYTDRLQPQLLGVPLLIPLAWLMMLPPAWAVAQRITASLAGLAVRCGQRARLHCLGLVPGPTNGTLGPVGVGSAGAVLRHPAGQLRGVVPGVRADHGAGAAARPARPARCSSSTR